MMTEQVYDVDYFIKKFEAIPEEKWCEGEFKDRFGACCVFGHCGLRDYLFIKDVQEAVELNSMFDSSPYSALGVTGINDGNHPDYQQPTAKQRILAALNDLKVKADAN
jgi:hypothetical protein